MYPCRPEGSVLHFEYCFCVRQSEEQRVKGTEFEKLTEIHYLHFYASVAAVTMAEGMVSSVFLTIHTSRESDRPFR